MTPLLMALCESGGEGALWHPRQGETAENLVEQFGISREDQDAFALWSQQKAARAQERGRFRLEKFAEIHSVKKIPSFSSRTNS